MALSKEVNLRYFDNGDVGQHRWNNWCPVRWTHLISVFAMGLPNDRLKAFNRLMELVFIPDTLKKSSSWCTRCSGRITRKRKWCAHQAVGPQRYFVGTSYDFAGFVHHEAECSIGDASAEPSRIWWNASAGSADQAQGYLEMIQNAEAVFLHMVFCRQVSNQTQGCRANIPDSWWFVLSRQASVRGHRDKVLFRHRHGNPASAVQAGFNVVICACDEQAMSTWTICPTSQTNRNELAALDDLPTLQTHGMIETSISWNMRAHSQLWGSGLWMVPIWMRKVGPTNPGFIGADVLLSPQFT